MTTKRIGCAAGRNAILSALDFIERTKTGPMPNMILRYFKTALIATAISFVACIAVGIAGMIWIHGSGVDEEKRAGMLGQGVGTLMVLAAAPFWLYGAYCFGNERRAVKEAAQRKTPAQRRRNPKKDS